MEINAELEMEIEYYKSHALSLEQKLEKLEKEYEKQRQGVGKTCPKILDCSLEC